MEEKSERKCLGEFIFSRRDPIGFINIHVPLRVKDEILTLRMEGLAIDMKSGKYQNICWNIDFWV